MKIMNLMKIKKFKPKMINPISILRYISVSIQYINVIVT